MVPGWRWAAISGYVRVPCRGAGRLHRGRAGELNDRMVLSMGDISRTVFGQLGTEPVYLYTLKNQQGAVLEVTNYGARVTALHVADRFRQFANVVHGFRELGAYLEDESFLGCTVGRVANRIRNAEFTLHGRRYELEANDGPHHLNGGSRAWDKRLWRANSRETPDGLAVVLRYTSPDGEDGYPGRLEVSTVYMLTHDGAFIVEMGARADRTTIVNMAHHTYWNLAGQGGANVLDHELVLESDFYTPGDPTVPIGYVDRVATTRLDFRVARPVGRDLSAVAGAHAGYSHYWVVRGDPRALRPVARVQHPASGRALSLEANAPGVEFRTGDAAIGASFNGFCLQTQAFPNAVNVPAWQEQVMLLPDERYRHTMVHRFSAE